MKVIRSAWFTGFGIGSAVIGIVVGENESGERKAYIGHGFGVNEKQDELHILKNGGKVTPESLDGILKAMGASSQESDREIVQRAIKIMETRLTRDQLNRWSFDVIKRNIFADPDDIQKS